MESAAGAVAMFLSWPCTWPSEARPTCGGRPLIAVSSPDLGFLNFGTFYNYTLN